ncbi:MAG TPA: endo-1,4-beta-xylanase [Candidatus Eisenbacteria bacterium]|jgi:GH35 family endo-1,4-beta-xylanase|nr:endo-1,4-beta-xylanase [Candidatus Eisenbacteria bacterium]
MGEFLDFHVPRRRFLKWSSAAVAGAVGFRELPVTAQDTAQQLGAEEAKASAEGLTKDVPQLRVLMHEADGKALDSERAHTLIARDLANDPLPQPSAIAEGRARIGLAAEPLQLGLRLKVQGFGEVYCYADNNGKGYTKPGQIEFVADAAATRLRRLREAAESAKQSGVPRDAEFEKHIEAAARKIPAKAGAEQIAVAYEALSHGLHAGEKLTLNIARHRINKLAKPRTEFLFGGLASGWQSGLQFEKPFTELFNFATISWYTWSQNPEPAEQRIDYTRMDQSVDWCLAHKIVPKGFGYVYLTNGATPEWFRKWPYEKVLPEYKRIVAQTTRRYEGRVPYVEVMNEAHDKANLFRFSHEQILELAREACRAAREGSPTAKRLINHCCQWAEYARRANADGVRRWSPFRFLKDCLRADVEFETVGLQLYYPQQDLFEIDRMIDRFKAFQRRLHITEISCNSADGLDPASMRPKSFVPGWHGPWNETMQADWLESIYTICYSKPEFEAVGYWDLADVGGHFWPNGGLLRKDFSPKESYGRLLKLKKQWGL